MQTLQLPWGTTGFRDLDDPPLPTVDLRVFRTDLFQIARSVNAEVVHAPRFQAAVECSFLNALLCTRTDQFRVLLNSTHPLLAIAADFREGGCPVFVEHPELCNAFQELGRYTVLTKSVLEQPVDDAVVSLLGRAELEQLAYWNPTRVGDVVFNDWD